MQWCLTTHNHFYMHAPIVSVSALRACSSVCGVMNSVSAGTLKTGGSDHSHHIHDYSVYFYRYKHATSMAVNLKRLYLCHHFSSDAYTCEFEEWQTADTLLYTLQGPECMAFISQYSLAILRYTIQPSIILNPLRNTSYLLGLGWKIKFHNI